MGLYLHVVILTRLGDKCCNCLCAVHYSILVIYRSGQRQSGHLLSTSIVYQTVDHGTLLNILVTGKPVVMVVQLDIMEQLDITEQLDEIEQLENMNIIDIPCLHLCIHVVSVTLILITVWMKL